MHPPPYSPLFPQQPTASESLFSTFPFVHSDSPLHSHGSDPLGSSALYALFRSSYGRQSISSPDTNADTQNWIVKQVRSMRYEAAAKASHGTSAVSASFSSAWNDIWVRQLLPSLTPLTLPMPNQTKANEPMQCEVCKIDCTNKDVFEKLVTEEKHRKNMQLLNSPTNTAIPGASHASLQSQINRVQGQDLFGVVSKELESKKQKLVSGGAAVDSVRVCTICNVACNSQDVYNKHLSGKKHAAQISLMSDNGIGSHLAAFKHLGIGPWKKGPKKISTQPAWCELCKISCNSRDVYMTHLAGRKHLRNLGLLSKSNNALQRATNPVVRPQERPNTCEDEGIDSQKPNKAAMVEDIEAKKRKLIKGGAAETDIRICTLCNVVCNSQTVFNFHLAGQKHAVMVKLMMQKQPGLLAEMSNNFRSDTDTSFNAEELLKIKTRCRELRKEKDMINCSQSQIFELLRIIELHEKSLLETSIKDKTHIQRLEEELLNCSQEIDYLKDQLNGRNMEVKYLQELVYSFKLK
ncbi:uncharacterized protein LOC114713271 [Neltuma alba]|uniref:uncharacterized protein LOC114713271 n=1 Tax=Neltuma alba TaxID=207710 RepID=UPI0010A383A8|nr:uncharacterized protein LOC114713271 [Prosopis alba]